MNIHILAEATQARTISVVVPVYNEETAIKPFLDRIAKVMDGLPAGVEYQVIFVNDGSSDATEIVVHGLAAQNERVTLINLSRNFGKEAALMAGLDMAPGDAVIPMDVDLQDPPELIIEFVDRWLNGAKVVNARRVDRSQDSWLKRQSASSFYRLYNALADRPIPENVGDFRLLDRQVVDVVRSLGERARFNKALFSWVGFDAEEVTYERPARTEGTTSWSYWKLWNFALDGIFASSTTPLRVWGYVGFLMAIASFLYAVMILVMTIIGGRDTPGYASTLIVILTFGGLNMIALGIIGEYVGRIYKEVRQRPLYVVRSSVNLSGDD